MTITRTELRGNYDHLPNETLLNVVDNYTWRIDRWEEVMGVDKPKLREYYKWSRRVIFEILVERDETEPPLRGFRQKVALLKETVKGDPIGDHAPETEP